MNWEETKNFLQPCLPHAVYDELAEFSSGELQEIRFRSGKHCIFHTAAGVKAVAWIPDQRNIETLAEALCGHGLFTRQSEIRQGYVTLRGGHRLGLCGSVQLQHGKPDGIMQLGSLCLRIAAEWKGSADRLVPLCNAGMHPQSMLIVGSCGTGKTTLLRDIARQLASASSMLQTAVVDERSELAACENGVPQLDIGETTDVLDRCPKAEAIPWLLRSMSPRLIITDELANAEDVSAIMEAAACGCAVIASVHGTSLNDLAARPVMASMMAKRIFAHYAVLSPDGCGRISTIYDRNGSPIRWPV